MSDTADRKELVYVVDPMCSWCWGFSPVIKAIARQIAAFEPTGALPRPGITPIMGGLRPLTRTPMSDDEKASIRHHWDEVERRSGQPFDPAFFDREDWAYDTEPACRAVCLVRHIAPRHSFDYLERVHRAHYAENRDVTRADVLAELAHEVAGIETADFLKAFHDVAIIYETAGDFHAARQLGVTGYPTVILQTGNELTLLTQGYQPYDDLQTAVAAWLDGTLETQRAAS